MNLKPFVFLLLLSSGVFPVFADFPRHVDPDILVLDNPDPTALFKLYTGIYNEISQSQYTSALELLVSVDELYATPDAKESISDYNLLLRQVISELNDTEVNINQAFSDLVWLRESDAYDSLLDAIPRLLDANSTTVDLDMKSYELANMFSGSPSVLLEGTGQIEQLVENLDQLILQGFLNVDKIITDKLAGLETTFLRINVNDTAPFPGDSVSISGILMSASSRLSGKDIEIMFNGVDQGVIETGENGEFIYLFSMPELYTTSVPLQVSYWPNSDDIGQYSPVVSRLSISPSYFTPVFELETLDSVLPGIQYSIKSKVEIFGDPLEGISFNVTAFGETFSYISNELGDSTIFVNVPNNAPTGLNSIILSYAGSGVYGPVLISRTFDIERMETVIELDSMGIYLSGRNALISGKVYSSGIPVQECLVEVQLDDEVESTFTDGSGSFSVLMSLDLFVPSIRKEFVITAIPEHAWISRMSLLHSFLVINSLSMVLIPGFVILILFRRKPRPITPSPNSPRTPIDPIEYYEEPGIIGIYISAVKLVSKWSGVFLSSNLTIREFLHKIKPIIYDPVFTLFNQLSKLYEEWVYGPKEANPPVIISSQLLEQMKEKDEEN